MEFSADGADLTGEMVSTMLEMQLVQTDDEAAVRLQRCQTSTPTLAHSTTLWESAACIVSLHRYVSSLMHL